MVDEFATWRRNFVLRAATGYALALDLRVGAELVRSALNRATKLSRRTKASCVTWWFAAAASRSCLKRVSAASSCAVSSCNGAAPSD